MGRPSAIYVDVDSGDKGPFEVRVGGKAVEIAEGKLFILRGLSEVARPAAVN